MSERDLRASRRYATALFSACSKADKLDVVERDIAQILELFRSTPIVLKMWESPLLPAGRKRDLVTQLFETSIDPLTLGFLRLLVDKRREVILETVRYELRQLADRSRHLVRADVVFAIQPTDAEKTALVKSLEARTGDKVEITVSVEPAILGGVIVRMQDTILDGSVRGTFEKLREQLLQEA